MSGRAPETHYRVPIDGDELATVVTTAPSGEASKMAMLLHGGPGGQKDGPDDLYVHLAQQLAGSGIASVRFDFRGCGESTGRYRDMTVERQALDLAAVKAFIDDRYRPGACAIVGESFGATVALAKFDAADYRAMVLLWPAIWLLDGAFESYLSDENLSTAGRDGYVELDGEQIGLDFLAELKNHPDVAFPLAGLSVPCLLIHGDSDTEVPYRQSERAADMLTGPKRLVLVRGGDHCLSAPDERVIVYHETVAWLSHYL